MNKPFHLLLMPPNWIGDVIMAQPAMKAIVDQYRSQYPDCSVSLSGRAWLKDLLPWLNLGSAEYQAEIPAADHAYLFPNSFRVAWQCRQAGVKQIIGYRGQWRSLLLHRAASHRINTKTEHHRLFHLDLARQNGIPVHSEHVDLSQPEGAYEAGIATLQQHNLDPERTIAIAPGAQFGAAKCYPPQGFGEVGSTLSRAGWQVVLLGMPEDRTMCDQIATQIDGPTWNAAGETTLTQALQIIAASKLMLCNDSGLMHVAAGLGIPTITPFGATDPARTAPDGAKMEILYHPASCSPCLQRECSVDGHPCMANITATMLIDACLKHLS